MNSKERPLAPLSRVELDKLPIEKLKRFFIYHEDASA